jgi:hypothetical protein
VRTDHDLPDKKLGRVARLFLSGESAGDYGYIEISPRVFVIRDKLLLL